MLKEERWIFTEPRYKLPSREACLLSLSNLTNRNYYPLGFCSKTIFSQITTNSSVCLFFKYFIFHIFKPQLLFQALKISFISQHITYVSVQFSNFRVDVCNLSSQRASWGLLISFIQINGTSEILGNGQRCGIEKQGQHSKENIECIYVF